MAMLPFALEPTSLLLVDIDDVPRGKACNCICPCCQSPLIARHCKENRENHFAHDPAFKDTQAYRECDLSYEVALRLMLKQLLKAAGSIYVPSYHITERHSGKKLLITKQQTLTYQSVTIQNQGLDAILCLGEYKLGVFISYPARSIAHIKIPKSVTGVIELNLTEFFHHQSKVNTRSCKQALSEIISSHSQCKTWYWHQRQVKLLKMVNLQYHSFVQERARDTELKHDKSAPQLAKFNILSESTHLKQNPLDKDEDEERNSTRVMGEICRTMEVNSHPTQKQKKVERIENTDIRHREKWRCTQCHIDYLFSQSYGVCPNCSSNWHSYPIE